MFKTDDTEVWSMSMVEGGYTSNHFHRQRVQMVHVISGILAIVFDGTKRITFTKGAVVAIKEGRLHKLVAVTDVKLTEVYLGSYTGEDIERRDTGGVKVAAGVA